jgi:alkanesulfonate monooxygenase SsuD/methylene tetrahydromethanopterin reductase-like flavin-dependent oxidoreductase (luciferase family)
MLSAIIVPLHDPIRLAEQLSVLDHLSEGRVWSVAGAGYRAIEFEMAGVEMKRRGALLESHLRTMIQAWTGEPFEYEGRTVRVTPKPFSDPHPRVLVGGGVEVAARRAARLHLPMMPMNTDPKLQEWYHDEAEKVGYTGGFVMVPQGPTFIHVTHDPEKTWAEIGEYLLYETQTYASFQTPGQWSTPKVDASSVEDLKKSAQIVVGTPEQVIEVARSIPPFGAMTFNPLAGGLPPKLAWESLELFAAEVLPKLRVDG